MIGKLQGIVDYIGEDYVILMTGGVGYKVFVPKSHDFTALRPYDFWIETIVREDSIRLFGFGTLAEQNLFNQLIGVSGVGPRVAMAIMGTLSMDVLTTAILTGDAKTITAAPGVGKKVAEKIILELKGKSVLADNYPSPDGATSSNLSDLLSALETLGYKRIDIAETAQKLVRENANADTGTLVRMALKEITK